MELILALVVILLAIGGLGVGILLTGRPPQTSCSGLACAGGTPCAGCPRRQTNEARDE